MLAGLIFLGMLAAVSFPDMMDLARSDTDDTGADESADESAAQDDIVEAPEPEPEFVPEENEFDPADGEDLFVDPQPGTTVVEAFNPSVDTLTISVPDEAQEFAASEIDDEQPATLTYETAEGVIEVRFPGLQTVPINDIYLRVSDAASPTLDADIALTQLMEDDSPEVLEPFDPDLPNLPSAPPGQQGDPGIAPVDPTVPDVPVTPLDQDAPVLSPVEDEAVPAAAANLAELMMRDGGSDVGLTTGGDDITVLSPTDDIFSQPDTGDTGALTLTQAAPQVLSPAGVSVVDLGGGDDAFTGGDGATYGFGGAGDDVLAAGSGAAALFGGTGDDVLTGDLGDTFLHGGEGDDTLSGGPRADYLDGGEHGEIPGDGDDEINGNDGDDTIRGGYGADLLRGGAGDDVINHRGADAERIVAERSEFAWHVDETPDTLIGNNGDDTLIFDRGDLAVGGVGADTFWLYSDAEVPDPIVADVADFTPGEDFLRISLNPQIRADGVVAVVPSEDGLDGFVQVDGTTVAVLRGAPDATLADIFVETRPDVFPAG